ncbi:MAG: tryptophan-rich sensory protein [Chloroflexi bacterium]|nr:tryptophan-rich sensory protein [Chloroflexota bacterium]
MSTQGDSPLMGNAQRGQRSGRGLIALVISLAIPLAVGGIGGAITARAIPVWYAELTKPTWNPPSWLFGPVWTLLYLGMGVAAWRIWRRGSAPEADGAVRAATRTALAAYALQLVLNASWTPVFFGLKRIDLAFLIIVVMLAAIVETIRRFFRLDRGAAWLLFPYLGWVIFATVLNGRIWQRNP